MHALVAMILSLLLLVALLQTKVKIGRAMLLSALVLAVMLHVTPSLVLAQLKSEFENRPLSQTTPYLFITLTALLMFVNILGVAMRRTGVAARLAPAAHALFKSRRAALSVIPLLMGMLPTPGGIMLSAPMVRELGDQLGVERSRSAAINFYFRHQWESIWPLFPALPLLQSMLATSVVVIITHNLVISFAGIAGGIIFLLLFKMPPKDKNAHADRPHLRQNAIDFLHAFWPIALAAVLYAAFNIPPALGVLIAIFGFLFLHKIKAVDWPGVFKAGTKPDMALLIGGALLYKLFLESAQAVPEVVDFLHGLAVPPMVIIFLLPFLVAFLTGITTATIAITFPFLIPYIGTGSDAQIPLQTLAFSGLLCGLYLTPVHLCLALSVGYFETTLPRIIAKVLPPVLVIAAAGALAAIVLT